MTRKTVLRILLLVGVLHGGPSLAQSFDSSTFPLTGQLLDYDVYWTGMLVGRVTVKITGPTTLSDNPCYQIETFASTVGAVEKIYKAKEKFVGFLGENAQSLVYEEWEKEKKDWNRDRLVFFDWKESLAKRMRKEAVRNTVPIDAQTFCPVGAAHYLLTRPLQPGDHYEVTVTEGKDLYLAKADVVEGEPIETETGPVETVKVLPQVYWKGQPLGNRSYSMWVTNDARRIPVKLFVDVEYGSFTGILTEYRPPTVASVTP